MTNDGPAKQFVDRMYSELPLNPLNPDQIAMVYGEGEDQQLALWELETSKTDPNTVHVKFVSAYPRRKGVGTKAMRDMQDMAAKAGVRLELTVWKKGPVSELGLRAFYKKMGFKPDGRGMLAWDPPAAAPAAKPALDESRARYRQELEDAKRYLAELKEIAGSPEDCLVVFGYMREHLGLITPRLKPYFEPHRVRWIKFLLGEINDDDRMSDIYELREAVEILHANIGVGWPELVTIDDRLDELEDELDESAYGSALRSIEQHDADGSLEGYVVGTDQVQLGNYLSSQGADQELISRIAKRYGTVGIIKNMWVDEEHRGQGVGSGLLESAIDEAFSIGADAIVLVCDTGEDNSRMGKSLEQWYQGWGFETVGTAGGDPVMVLERSTLDESVVEPRRSELFDEVRQAFARKNPMAAAEVALNYDVRDIPGMHELYMDNRAQFASMVVDELLRGDADPQALAGLRKDLDINVGIPLPDDVIGAEIDRHDGKIHKVLLRIEDDEGLIDAIRLIVELRRWGSAPDFVIDDGDDKRKIIKELMSMSKGQAKNLLSKALDTLSEFGIAWPEIDAMRRNLGHMPDRVSEAMAKSKNPLTHRDPVEVWIRRFQSSNNPKLKGKTPAQLERMARAAQAKAVQNHNPYAPKPKSESATMVGEAKASGKATPTIGDLAEKHHCSLLMVEIELRKGIKAEMAEHGSAREARDAALRKLGKDLHHYSKGEGGESLSEAKRDLGESTKSEYIKGMLPTWRNSMENDFTFEVLESMVDHGATINDDPELKKLIMDNRDKLGELVVYDLQNDGDAATINGMYDLFERIGLAMPDPVIRDVIRRHSRYLRDELDAMIESDNMLFAVSCERSLNRFGAGFDLGIDLNDHKRDILRKIVRLSRENVVGWDALNSIDLLHELGIRWEELDVLRNNIISREQHGISEAIDINSEIGRLLAYGEQSALFSIEGRMLKAKKDGDTAEIARLEGLLDEIKPRVIRKIIWLTRNDKSDSAVDLIRAAQYVGVDWPELSMLHDSIRRSAKVDAPGGDIDEATEAYKGNVGRLMSALEEGRYTAAIDEIAFGALPRTDDVVKAIESNRVRLLREMMTIAASDGWDRRDMMTTITRAIENLGYLGIRWKEVGTIMDNIQDGDDR